MGRRDAGDHALHGVADLGPACDRERSHRAADRRGAWDHVARGPCRERGHGDDHGVERIGLAGGDLLQVRDHLGGNRDRVDRLVRARAVTSTPADLEREQVGGGHHGAGHGGDMAGLEIREQVHAGDEVCPVDDAGLDDLAGAAGRELFCVLEDEAHLSVRARGAARRAAEPRRAASPCGRRARRRASPPVASRRAGSRSPRGSAARRYRRGGRRPCLRRCRRAVKPCHDRRAGGALDLEAAERAQRLLDERGGFVLLERQFGVSVEMASPGDRARFELVRDEALPWNRGGHRQSR